MLQDDNPAWEKRVNQIKTHITDQLFPGKKTLSESGKTELATVFENVSKKLLENKKTLTEKAKKTATNVTDAVKEKISGKKKGFFS